MKTPIVIFFFLFALSAAHSQTSLAYINDPDGYTNVRKSPSTQSAILSKILTAELFECDSSSSPWWLVQTKEGVKGYVHHSRITWVHEEVEKIALLMDNIHQADPANVEFSESSNEQLFAYAGSHQIGDRRD